MLGAMYIANGYKDALREFTAATAPDFAGTRPSNRGPGDPLRPCSMVEIAPWIERLLAVRTDVPIEWQLGCYWAATGADLVLARVYSSATIGEALDVALENQRILSNVRTFEHNGRSGGQLIASHHCADPKNPILRFIFNAIMAAKLAHLFDAYSKCDAQHDIDTRAASFGDLLRRFDEKLEFIDIEFRDGELILAPQPGMLGCKVSDRDTRLIAALDRELRRRSSELPDQASWKDRIKHFIRSKDLARVSADEICEAFRIQRRTLGRLLQNEGTTYTAILTSLRRERALHLVGNSNLPLKRIASELGFNSDASFHMAFKSWTGTTPATFRRMREIPAAAEDSEMKESGRH
jgi:AraC-like DNA-binding protein